MVDWSVRYWKWRGNSMIPRVFSRLLTVEMHSKLQKVRLSYIFDKPSFLQICYLEITSSAILQLLRYINTSWDCDALLLDWGRIAYSQRIPEAFWHSRMQFHYTLIYYVQGVRYARTPFFCLIIRKVGSSVSIYQCLKCRRHQLTKRKGDEIASHFAADI